MINFPRFMHGLGLRGIVKGDTRPIVVDIDGALDAVEEFSRAAKPAKFRATTNWEKPPVFDIMRRSFNICPAAFQWDEVTGRIIELANLYPDGKLPPDQYDRRTLGLVQIAASAQAEYYRKKIPKPKDVDKRVTGK